MDTTISNCSFGWKIKGYQNVDKHVIRGGAPSVQNLIKLKKDGVTQIYDFRHDNLRGMKFIEVLMCKILKIDYRRRKFSFLNNETPKLKDFEEVSMAIKENIDKGGKTLLHCNSGHHRTGQMAIFYELTKGHSLEQAKTQLYPKTFKARATLLLNKLENNGEYFDRQYTENLSINPIKRCFQKRNNKVLNATKKAFNEFKEILLN